MQPPFEAIDRPTLASGFRLDRPGCTILRDFLAGCGQVPRPAATLAILAITAALLSEPRRHPATVNTG